MLTPHIKLLTVGPSIARQPFEIEGNTFLGSDYLLDWIGGAKIARNTD
jgi:hypothetical protein